MGAKDEDGIAKYLQPNFSAITEDSLDSQMFGVFFKTYLRFKEGREKMKAMNSDKYTTFFEDSQIFRETPPIYKFFLYFNLPYETIVQHQITP